MENSPPAVIEKFETLLLIIPSSIILTQRAYLRHYGVESRLNIWMVVLRNMVQQVTFESSLIYFFIYLWVSYEINLFKFGKFIRGFYY